ncbi:MAG: metallophosphoesterase [Candidatus Parvarchaeota archaeon]|nr:metallophosphoesterase [Candidatus Jingweiarchaeum tengchongense]MCW1298397.1 metallophosphoesterase [Candidatus Jingweiarchaeum tengchongense]MCW1300301.1 metallophosphoesterase [Candidatus Jingweiarchaeum tengchongense]MCW1304903.1 metallophosphoesterase [Candidatus Jingweiarchaeum tengchongense]MCW1305797.1 metallophosphoesterase [Candidatus Jingweiarchaeum tengchongense]
MFNIACTADIHAPTYFEDFKNALADLEKIDLFLLAGDIIFKGNFNEIDKVIDEIRKKFNGMIIACFGNEEYEEIREKLMERDIIWLDDDYKIIKLDGMKVGIIGTTGCLDVPTKWQSKHIPNIKDIYEERIKKIDQLISELDVDLLIILSHYSPTYKTIFGEEKFKYKWLACRKFEKVIIERKPNFWIHGHAHNSKITETKINTTIVLNVSLPAIKNIKTIKIDEGLRKFLV